MPKKKEETKLGRTPKFNVESVAKSVRVPLPSADFYFAQIITFAFSACRQGGVLEPQNLNRITNFQITTKCQTKK
jgi:hypothetical protein